MLARVWLARANDGILAARLELDKNGTGSLIISFSPEDPPRAFRVTRWSLGRLSDDLHITLAPIDVDPDGIAASGTASSGSVQLRLRGTAGTAKNVVSNLTFEPYDRVLAAI
jgi:hypothetical protein